MKCRPLSWSRAIIEKKKPSFQIYIFILLCGLGLCQVCGQQILPKECAAEIGSLEGARGPFSLLSTSRSSPQQPDPAASLSEQWFPVGCSYVCLCFTSPRSRLIVPSQMPVPAGWHALLPGPGLSPTDLLSCFLGWIFFLNSCGNCSTFSKVDLPALGSFLQTSQTPNSLGVWT